MLLSAKSTAGTITGAKLRGWRVEDDRVTFLYITDRDDTHSVRRGTQTDFLFDSLSVDEKINHALTIHQTN